MNACLAHGFVDIISLWIQVRVQSDPAGRLVITGQPEQPDNPWGITAFKKVSKTHIPYCYDLRLKFEPPRVFWYSMDMILIDCSDLDH